MFRHVDLQRYPAPPELTGLIDWFWSVRWSLPMGFTHRQDVISQPGVNLSIGSAPPPGLNPPPGPYPLHSVVNGVTTELSSRVLSGAGWNLAAKTSTGGFGAWVDDVQQLTDLVLPTSDLLAVDADLIAQVASVEFPEGATLLGAQLIRLLDGRPVERIGQAQEVAEIARQVEHDREIRRLDDLSRRAGVAPRTLQRMFASCAGVSPTWVIRRFRLIEAAELVREGQQADWSGVAAALGYADQAHLTRDFARTLGQTPAAYAREQRERAEEHP